ncbi:cellulose-binding protein [Streptomyces sp. H10-C2]|uniref:cellulose-binding protein n=1 Tax=unclassified Streptomyces TaxID=2593676 RepID=UPI0024BA7913|nr:MULTISPECIES: cellulose-binding protein [unclassified Streptomyces]MDJ0341334.1 cellulose-binding protein [Streptomyces sp. PH10-H1]MDJ0370929.1 cellulose-binding protein [Streptomyces sp. H10-C2]
MSSTASPHGFDTVRGRGYQVEQVERFLEELSEDRDAAWERAARLTVLANEMEVESTALREHVDALGPAGYETLSEGAQELLRLVEEEAAAVRERAENEAQYARDAAETARRALQDQTRAAAAERRAVVEDQANRVLDEARGRASELLTEVQNDAARVRGEAGQALEATRQDVARTLTELDKEQRERLDAFEHEMAEREAGVDSRIGELTGYAERRLEDARTARAEAEEYARHGQEDADARAAALLAEARMREERIRRESERQLREHEERSEEIRAHLAHVRTSLAALTGRPLPEEDPSIADPGPAPD